MKAVLRTRRLGQATRLNRPSLSHRALSSTPSARASRAESLAKAAEASATASERLSAGGPPLAGPSYAARQQANNLGRSQQLLSEPSDSNAQLRLSSSQARRSRAARFGTSRHVAYAPPTSLQSSADQLVRSTSEGDDDEAALAYAAPAGTSTSSIYLPEYVAWAISQLIAAANDPKLLRADHLKLAHLTDPQEHLAEAAHIPPKRSSLLHLATVSPQRYAAILAVFSEVRQRLSHRGPVQEADADLDAVLPTWTPQTVLDFDCAAGEGLWAAAQIFRQDDADPHSPTSLQHYHGFDRRPNLLKSGKKVAQASASNASPADIKPAARDVKLKDEGEKIVVDGVTYYEQEPSEADQAETDSQDAEAEVEYFSGSPSAMASVEKTFQSVPLAKDLVGAAAGGRSLALSAFALSLMTNDANRFEAVQALWDSGAEVMVIIDAATPRGFASVASARAQLLELGRQARGDERVHVVAPCSHDKPCPLLHPFAIGSSVAATVGARADMGNPFKSNDVCGFFARYHTPTFLRRTKHSDRGEENVAYSYVVVRRGPRPGLLSEAQRRAAKQGGKNVERIAAEMADEASSTKSGILDLIRSAKLDAGKRRQLEEVDASAAIAAPERAHEDAEGEMSDQQAMDELLKLLPDALKAEMQPEGSTSTAQLTPEQLDTIMASVRSSQASSSASGDVSIEAVAEGGVGEDGMIGVTMPTAGEELAMRLESYAWPRLIKPPLKKGGHVTFDACCSTGNVERFTISKAAGKQAYQDARKSKQGDLFPHPPRSRSVIKALNPLTALEYQSGAEEVDLMEKLTIRAPSKLNRSQQQVQLVGMDGEDAEDILAELYGDMDTGGGKPIDVGMASYRLISPNLVTPTRKQQKQISINYANKWNTPATTKTRLTNPRTNLNSTPQRKPTPTSTQGDGDSDGFQSSLHPPERKVRRSSRKKSRGDWDSELFGH